MAVVKIRASDHSNELRLYSIGEDGLRIGEMLPTRKACSGVRPASAPRSAGVSDRSRRT